MQHSSEWHLVSDRSAPRTARREVTAYLRAHHVGAEVRGDAALVVSELVTNAVRHTNSQAIVLEVRLQVDAISVSVHDEQPSVPTPAVRMTNVELDGERGRGLSIVAALSDETGSHMTRSGKVVWARLSRPDVARAAHRALDAPRRIPMARHRAHSTRQLIAASCGCAVDTCRCG